MLDEAGAIIEDARTYSAPTVDDAQSIYDKLREELGLSAQDPHDTDAISAHLESAYLRTRAISGTPLRDSYHLGSSIINDYGRPYENGFNAYLGASGYASAGRFTLYARGEFQRAPSSAGYPASLAQRLAVIDGTTTYFGTNIPLPLTSLTTIPAGPISEEKQFRVLEAYASAQYLNHVISFGKQDEWLGPDQGASMAYSNNAENVYALHINRIEPLSIPLLSRITGPFRYEFLVGPLRGHIYPLDPWIHLEKISFRPTDNLEFGFERTAIWGGKGHTPITMHTFLKSFFSFSAPNLAGKLSRDDPGARFGSFDFSYRVPFVRNWVTLYSDSEVHDDVSAIDAPRRASWRPGIFLSHVPGVTNLDFRAEGVNTDPPITNSSGGLFMYYESVQAEGYTNQGQLMGDWIGREGKGVQAWLTYHLSSNELLQLDLRNQKVAKDFIPGGTTLNSLTFKATKRIKKDLELDGEFTLQHWKAPIYLPGSQTVTASQFQITWFPDRKISF